jgi:hypothetical protein
MEDPRNGERSSWFLRRKIVIGTLYYCAVAVGYLILFGDDSALNAQVATALTGLAGAVIGSYVFGAVWEDRTKINAGIWPTSRPSFPRPAPIVVPDCADDTPPPTRAHQDGE